VETSVIRHVRSDWQDTVLVCGKCSKKVGGGFGRKGKTSLTKALREALRLGKGRKASMGIVETKCLGVCPKRAVVVARAGTWLVVPEGTSVGRVALELGLAGPRVVAERG
jgi:predicted metal-binding protein